MKKRMIPLLLLLSSHFLLAVYGRDSHRLGTFLYLLLKRMLYISVINKFPRTTKNGTGEIFMCA